MLPVWSRQKGVHGPLPDSPIWVPKVPSKGFGAGATAPSISVDSSSNRPILSPPSPLLHKENPNPSASTVESNPSTQLLDSGDCTPPLPSPEPMANFRLDPRRFLPAGLDIIDGGLERFPRAFYTASQPPPRMHEQYMVAIVEPEPPAHLVAVRRQQVLHFLTHDLQVMVQSAQTWFQGVGMFEMQNPIIRESFIPHPFCIGP